MYTKYLCELDMTGIETPVSLSAIPKFESQNPAISVNVLVYEKNDLIPVYTSKFNLLLLSNGDKFYYTLIKSLSRLVRGRTQSHCKAFVCLYCLHPFAEEHCLKNHLPECGRHPAQTIEYPKAVSYTHLTLPTIYSV